MTTITLEMTERERHLLFMIASTDESIANVVLRYSERLHWEREEAGAKKRDQREEILSLLHKICGAL